MRPFFLVSLLVLLSITDAAPQLGGILGGVLGDLPVVAPLLGATGAILDEIPILYASPPAFLQTKNPSPQCANINGGALLCCNSIINGDMPLVVELADLAGNFQLNPNSINGLFCKSDFETCLPGVKLCCQVDAISNPPIVNDVLSVALWCQETPEQDNGTCYRD
ncbi:hypothetical protein N431DRAFT_561920 [Stipitochalara longipes BDJ]|nr:hypothetical protein N431DRAFT_561920 [Stipitochalara longipes BDJ]